MRAAAGERERDKRTHTQVVHTNGVAKATHTVKRGRSFWVFFFFLLKRQAHLWKKTSLISAVLWKAHRNTLRVIFSSGSLEHKSVAVACGSGCRRPTPHACMSERTVTFFACAPPGCLHLRMCVHFGVPAYPTCLEGSPAPCFFATHSSASTALGGRGAGGLGAWEKPNWNLSPSWNADHQIGCVDSVSVLMVIIMRGSRRIMRPMAESRQSDVSTLAYWVQRATEWWRKMEEVF